MRNKWIPAVLLFALLFSACSPTDTPTYQPEEEAIPATEVEVQESSPPDEEAAEESSPPPTEAPPTDTPPQEIIHWEYPGKFQLTPLQSIFDCKTVPYFIPGQTYELSEICDQWDRNYFERPLDESLGELFPQLDIVQAEFGQDDNWYYTQIRVFAELVENLVLDGIYALEIDLDLDAKGDILIIATAPGLYPPDEWHTNGVQVWFDSDNDVGGPQAVLVDPNYDGNGYETLLVDSGMGDDPDLAFVKTSGEEPGLIEFGFKASLLGGAESFEWWVWAMREDVTAAKFDPVDFFPQDTLYALDNTCGWIYGSYLRDLPNICDLISPPIAKPQVCQPTLPAPTWGCPCTWNYDTCEYDHTN